MTITQTSLMQKIYVKQDMADGPLFKGDYINFGYWEGVDLKKKFLSDNDRIDSSKALYEQVLKRLSINSGDRILDVGCGMGNGPIMVLEKNSKVQVIGMDVLLNQINKSFNGNGEILKRSFNALFVKGMAEEIPFPDNYFNKIFSVEALQHFNDFKKFVLEVARTLTGKLVLTTFFFTKKKVSDKVYDMLPYVKAGYDKIIPIDVFMEELDINGFKDVTYESIGQNVWKGFDKWYRQIEKDHQDVCGKWGRNWLKLYNDGYVDYIIVSANI